VYPGYARLDLHANITRYSLTVNFYANNVTNTRGLIGGGLGELPADTFRYITPRTFGISVTENF